MKKRRSNGINGGIAKGDTPLTVIRSDGVYVARTKNFCKKRRRLKEIFLPCGFSAREAEGREEKPRRGTRGDEIPACGYYESEG